MFTTSCSLLKDVKTEFVVKNHVNSTANIKHVSIKQYIGYETRKISPNALTPGTTIAPGEKLFFEIAPYMAEGTELQVDVIFDDGISTFDSCTIIYVPEVKFKLVCNNTPGEAMFILRTNDEFESEVFLTQL
jgi:hypothetical protein